MADVNERYSQKDKDKAAELEKMFKENGWNEITLVHPENQDLVFDVTPHYYGNNVPTTADDVEYFGVEGWNHHQNLQLYGGDTILEVAKLFNDMPQLAAEHEDDVTKLRKFYEGRVAGHTEAQWELAHRISHVAYYGWCDAGRQSNGLSYVDYLNANMADIAVRFQLPLEVANQAMQLSEDGSTYSDWSKSVYGRRGRDYGDSDVEREDKLFAGLHEDEYSAAFAKEHPEVPLKDRKTVYAEIDDEIHREVVKGMPKMGVKEITVDGNPRMQVRVPHFGSSYFPDYKTVSPSESYIVLKPEQVEKQEDGNYNLILDNRQHYTVLGEDIKISSGEIHNRLCMYREYIKANDLDKQTKPLPRKDAGQRPRETFVDEDFERLMDKVDDFVCPPGM